jgi:ABC-type transporter Mla MlaB component
MDATRAGCAVNLDLSHGWHAASARIEWCDPEPEHSAEATVHLHGWIDRPALERLESGFVMLSERGVRRLSLDCAHVRHVEFGAVPGLAELLVRSAPGGLKLRGLSPHLRDLFRLAGCSGLVPAVLMAGAAGTNHGTRHESVA